MTFINYFRHTGNATHQMAKDNGHPGMIEFPRGDAALPVVYCGESPASNWAALAEAAREMSAAVSGVVGIPAFRETNRGDIGMGQTGKAQLSLRGP